MDRSLSSGPAVEAMFRLLVERIEDYGIFMLDREGHIKTWNHGSERNTGYRADEVLGRPFSLFFPEEDLRKELPRYILNVASAEGRWEGRIGHLRKDGSKFWADVVVTAIKDDAGGLIGFSKVTRDTTRRKWEEERFRAAVESAPNAMAMVDRSGKIVLVNAQTEKVFGYSREELLGRSVEILVPQRFRVRHPDYRGGFFADPKARAMGAGRDLFGLRKDGIEIPVEIGLNPIETDEGKFVLASIVDITERKRAEQKFRMAVESAPNPMVMVDARGTIVLVNAQVERLLSYRREELLGKPVEILVPERFRPRHPEYRRDFMASPAVRPMGAGRDLFAVRKDGTEVPVEIGLNPIETDEGKFVLASIVDLTERKRLEASQRFLVEASSLLSSSLDYESTLASLAKLAVPQLADCCVVDVVYEDGSIRHVAFAHREADRENELLRRLANLSPQPSAASGSPRVIQEGRPLLLPRVGPGELEVIAPDPAHLALLSEIGVRSAIIVPMKSGERTLGAICFAFAGSNRSYGPQDLQLAEELARRAGIAVENARHYREAREAVRARDEFLSIASHELKTPLTTLQLQLQGLERQRARGTLALAPPVMESLGVFERQCRRLANLVDILLDVSRVTSGRLRLVREPLDLCEVARAVVARQEDDIKAHGADVRIETDGKIVGRWDRLRLDQVVTNLLTNALKYGRGRHVTITVRRAAGHAHLTVEDQGIGIDPKDLRRLFRPFERGVLVQHIGGLGMGLYIVKQVVEAHGGTISVRSAPGSGSAFSVELPLEPEGGPPHD